MSFFKKFAIAFLLTIVLFGGGQSHFFSFFPGLSANGQSTSSDTIFELAINKVKPGQLDFFKFSRETFVAKMLKEKGVGPNPTFLSFFTLSGELDTEVYIGLTEWDSQEAINQAAQNLGPTRVFKNYAKTFDQLAYVRMKPEDGQPFDINQIVKKGQVVEFAVRTVKPEFVDDFPERRKAFFDIVAEQKGYVLDREFVAVEGDELVVIIAWDSLEDFQNALQNLTQKPEMQEFFSILDVTAYQASQKVE
jgi:heme-degrading monooxygenase HmoA